MRSSSVAFSEDYHPIVISPRNVAELTEEQWQPLQRTTSDYFGPPVLQRSQSQVYRPTSEPAGTGPAGPVEVENPVEIPSNGRQRSCL